MSHSKKDVMSIHGNGDFIVTNAGRIYYEVEGTGPPVFLIAGGPGSGHTHYHPWFSQLADQHTVVYFDPLGTGRSDRLDDLAGYTLQAYAQTIDDLRQELGFSRINLLGLSFGSLPALEYTVSYTKHVDHLILSNGHLNAATWQAGNIDNVLRELELLFPEKYEEMLRLRENGVLSSAPEYQDLFSPLMPNLNWVDMDGHPPLFRPDDAAGEGNFDVYRAFVGDDPEWEVSGTLKGFDPSAALKNLEIPTLIVTGRYCRVTPPTISYQILNAFPEGVARLEIFERSAHRPWVEESEAYFAVVKEFLAKTRL